MRMNPEQSSKVKMRESTLQSVGEDRWVEGKQPMNCTLDSSAGVLGTARFEGHLAQRGRPVLGEGSRLSTSLLVAAWSGVGGAHSTAEAEETRWREGASLLGASEEAKEEEIGVSLMTPEKIRRFQKKLYIRAKQEPKFRFYQLYDKVWREDILHARLQARPCKSGERPGRGRSELSATSSREGREKWLEGLRKELREKTYKPEPGAPGHDSQARWRPDARWASRRYGTGWCRWLPSWYWSLSSKRTSTIAPTAIVRSALPGMRSGKWTSTLLREGYTDVVDADLSKYFDTIPHHELMQSVARRVADRTDAEAHQGVAESACGRAG